jgi:hypothetical protein
LEALQQPLVTIVLEEVGILYPLQPIWDFTRLKADWQLSADSIEDVQEEIEQLVDAIRNTESIGRGAALRLVAAYR